MSNIILSCRKEVSVVHLVLKWSGGTGWFVSQSQHLYENIIGDKRVRNKETSNLHAERKTTIRRVVVKRFLSTTPKPPKTFYCQFKLEVYFQIRSNSDVPISTTDFIFLKNALKLNAFQRNLFELCAGFTYKQVATNVRFSNQMFETTVPEL